MKQDVRFAEDVARDVTADFENRKAARRPYELAWRLDLNFVMGNQYCGISGDQVVSDDTGFYWQQKQVFNHIAPIVETRISHLTGSMPSAAVLPGGDSAEEIAAAELSAKVLDAECASLDFPSLYRRAANWSEVCGTAFYKVVWDDGGRSTFDGETAKAGDVSISVCSPFEIYPDSNLRGGISECQSIIHAKVYTASEVAKIWGISVKGSDVSVFGMTGSSGKSGGTRSVTEETAKDSVVVIERYTRPDKDNPDGKLEIVAGDALIYLGKLPYVVGEGQTRDFPFVRQVCYEQPGCFWGASVVERLIPVQRAYNALKNRKYEFISRLSMGVLAVEDGSVDEDDLAEEGLSPGKVLVYRQGSPKPEILSSDSVPKEFSDEEDRLLSEFVVISGVSEFARNSSAPDGMISGVALQLIAEQDEMRMAPSANSARDAYKTVCKMILRLYRQFVHVKRKLNFFGGGKTAVLSFSSADLSCGEVSVMEKELPDGFSARKSLLLELLSAGVLCGSDGKMSVGTRQKLLSMLGLDKLFAERDTAQLHASRADAENSDFSSAKVLPVDDHAIHVDRHVRAIISCSVQDIAAALAHVEEHKRALKEQNGQV